MNLLNPSSQSRTRIDENSDTRGRSCCPIFFIGGCGVAAGNGIFAKAIDFAPIYCDDVYAFKSNFHL
jgi:hypothetical protein